MLLDPYQFRAVTILNIVRESPNAVSVQLELPSKYTYTSGQHAIVRVQVDGTKATRQYSFSSAPESGEFWLTVVKTPGGMVSTWFVHDAKIGDTVEVSKPFTGPLMQENTRGKIGMIAGGSGIAPLMSHLRKQRLQHKNDIKLLYTTRSVSRCFENELQPLPGEEIVVHCSDTQGHVTAKDISRIVQGCDTVYICGSRPFVQTMREYCKNTVPKAALFSESFTL